jgi:hypothetical protein
MLASTPVTIVHAHERVRQHGTCILCCCSTPLHLVQQCHDDYQMCFLLLQVPLSVNNIPGVTGDTQAVSDLSPTAQQHSQAAEHPSKQPAAAASSVRNHKSR